MDRSDIAHTGPATAEPSLFGRLVERDAAASSASPARFDGIATGRLEAIGEAGELRVSIPALDGGTRPARSLVPLGAEHLGQSVALGFEGADPQRPIILGLMLGAADTSPERATAPEGVDARVDGRRLILSADQEIELRCGEAAIVLSADGCITLRGTYITSQASATQRILGGSVNVN